MPQSPRRREPAQPKNLHGRISELETLVMSLMEAQPLPTPSPSPSSAPSLPASVDELLKVSKAPKTSKGQDEAPLPDPGTLNLRDCHTSYVQSGHWEAILTKIRGLKEDLITDSKTLPGSHVFYGPTRHASREEILSTIPPRLVVDRLISIHFDAYLVTPFLIHTKKFYDAFWADPSETPFAWIGFLFAMLYVAVQLQGLAPGFRPGLGPNPAGSAQPDYLAMKDVFREKAVQCLVLARYTTGGPHVLEALITLVTGEFILMKDGANDGWLLIGLIHRIAMHMGFHRDPDHFPGLSPFEGEMRRRIWAAIMQMDLLFSLEMGLSRNATDAHTDTRQPRNFRDCDFDEDTTEMPPPRPDTEWTPVLPLITKARLRSALGLICDINADIHPPSDEKVNKVEKLLEELHNQEVPSILRFETSPHAITDTPSLVIYRVATETTYHKSRILLHRRALVHFLEGQIRQHDRRSVQICLDSALKILTYQQMLNDESQPFGRLSQLRWKVVLIFNQDVLLATSILCLYLQDVDKFEAPEGNEPPRFSPGAKEIRERLSVAYLIWLEVSAVSPSAAKVAKALRIVLGTAEEDAGRGELNSMCDSFLDLESMALNGFGMTSNNQYLPSGFPSSLSFFDNVLETWGG
ncbi:fungal specific transcription factor domain-containing protein [Sarocladium implicatum]|nr:fungal specific transcription factor domain-containing protein [Sarocladium implicatum]